MIYPQEYNPRAGRIRAFLRDLFMAVMIIIACYVLGIILWAAQASADTHQTQSATITATVQTSVDVTEDGCFIDEEQVDCNDLEPAGGSDDE